MKWRQQMEHTKCLGNLMVDLEIIALCFRWCHIFKPFGYGSSYSHVHISLFLRLEDNIYVTGFFSFFFSIFHLSAHTFVECFIWIFIIRRYFFFFFLLLYLLAFIHLSSFIVFHLWMLDLYAHWLVCACARASNTKSGYHFHFFFSSLASLYISPTSGWLIKIERENKNKKSRSEPSVGGAVVAVDNSSIIIVGDTAKNKRHSTLINKNANFGMASLSWFLLMKINIGTALSPHRTRQRTFG